MNGAKVAVNEINEAGGIKALGGAKLELLIADVQSKPDVGMAETERLIREGVSMLIGSWGTDITLAATQVSSKYGIPHLIDAAVSPEITQRGFKHIFKLMGAPETSALAALRDIPRLSEMTGVKPKTAVIFVVDTLYGRNMAKFYEKHLSKILDIGVTVKYPPGTKDLTIELTKIKAMKPDLLLVTNYVPDGILMTRQMKTLDFNCMAIWGMYDAARCVEEFITGLGKLADYQWNTIENSDYKLKRYWEASEKYKKLMGHNLPMDAAFSYTLMYVFADALERAKSTNKEKLIEALRKTYLKDHFLAGGQLLLEKTASVKMITTPLSRYLAGRFRISYLLNIKLPNPFFLCLSGQKDQFETGSNADGREALFSSHLRSKEGKDENLFKSQKGI